MFEKRTMDEIDREIISYLLKNGRMSKTKIADKLGLSEVAVRKRLKNLEKEKIILGYRALVNYRKLGYVCSITGIDVEPEYMLSVLKRLSEMRFVNMILLTSGDHDIIAEIMAKDMESMHKIHKDISGWEGVKRTCPAVITETVSIR